MTKETTLMGVTLIIFGIALLLITSFHVMALIYGISAIVIGLAIMIFNKEDKIEERKDLKKPKAKK